MKKIILLIAMMGLLMGVISCGNDEPKRGTGVFTVEDMMINHAYNTKSDQVLGLSTVRNKLTVDTKNRKANVEFKYNDGQGEKTLVLEDLIVTPKGVGFFEFTSASVSTFSGYVDVNEESAMRFFYTTPEGIRIISTTSNVFFLNTHNTITYDDATKPTDMENVMYEFKIEPASKTAVVTVSGIEHAKDLKYFNSITAASVPFTVTANGFTFSGENLKTDAIYRNYVDSTGSVRSHTDKYPFKTFNATVDMKNDRLNAEYMMGSSSTVVATGRTYLEFHEY